MIGDTCRPTSLHATNFPQTLVIFDVSKCMTDNLSIVDCNEEDGAMVHHHLPFLSAWHICCLINSHGMRVRPPSNKVPSNPLWSDVLLDFSNRLIEQSTMSEVSEPYLGCGV